MVLNRNTYISTLLGGIILICLVCLILRWQSLSRVQDSPGLGLQATPRMYTPAGGRQQSAAKADDPELQADTGPNEKVQTDTEAVAKAARLPDKPTRPQKPGSPDKTAAAQDSELDLNLASQAQLEELPGIGRVIAARIIAWREAHGHFESVAQLVEVEGIGEATLARLKPLIRVKASD